MSAQAINTAIQVSNTTVQTILQLLLKEKQELKNPEALIVDVNDIGNVLEELNKAGIPWTTNLQRKAIFQEDEHGNKVYDENGQPILLGYKEEPARTPDGQNFIIMVSGHDRPMQDPDTGEVLFTAKGNIKMVGGNIDRAVMIRNQVRDNRMKHNIGERNLPRDDRYQGDFVKMEFPGFESRARFIEEIRGSLSANCIIPSDFKDHTLYVRQDLFDKGTKENGEPYDTAPIDIALKNTVFYQQFPEYNELIKMLDEDLDKTIERVERAATDPNVVLRFANVNDSGFAFMLGGHEFEPNNRTQDDIDQLKDEDLTMDFSNDTKHGDKVFVRNQKGYIYQKLTTKGNQYIPTEYDLTDITQRHNFISNLRNSGYGYSVEGLRPQLSELQDFQFRTLRMLDLDFVGIQNDLVAGAADMNRDDGVRNNVNLTYKNGDEVVEPERGSTWTSIEVSINNTQIVKNIDAKISDSTQSPDQKENSDSFKEIVEKSEKQLAQTISVTMVDGQSLTAGMFVDEIVRNSDKGQDEIMKTNPNDDSISEFHRNNFSDTDNGHAKDQPEIGTDIKDPSDGSTIEDIGTDDPDAGDSSFEFESGQ